VRWWLWLVVPCLPCLALCGGLWQRKGRTDRGREAAAVGALNRINAWRADAGTNPPDLAAAGIDAQGLSYTLCPDGGFELAWTDGSVGMLPSDFEHRWNPRTWTWELKEMGVDPSCQ
jgi:hypothetical protein